MAAGRGYGLYGSVIFCSLFALMYVRRSSCRTSTCVAASSTDCVHAAASPLRARANALSGGKCLMWLSSLRQPHGELPQQDCRKSAP